MREPVVRHFFAQTCYMHNLREFPQPTFKISEFEEIRGTSSSLIPVYRWYQSKGSGSLSVSPALPGVALLPVLDFAVLGHFEFLNYFL